MTIFPSVKHKFSDKIPMGLIAGIKTYCWKHGLHSQGTGQKRGICLIHITASITQERSQSLTSIFVKDSSSVAASTKNTGELTHMSWS